MAYKRISPMPIVEGGTNATTMANTDGVVIYDGASLVTTSAGTTGQVLTGNTGSAPTFQAAAAGGITTLDGDLGSATGSTVTFTANSDSGATVNFSGGAAIMRLLVTDGNFSTVIGSGASNGSATGNYNCGLGIHTLNANTSGGFNSVIGGYALSLLTSGVSNNAMGINALRYLLTGNYNIGIGSNAAGSTTGAGSNYTTSESSNICLNSTGTTGESNVLRIGAGTGSSGQQLNKAFISGINGITVTGTAVLVSASDQLGIAVSSERYKENINDLTDSRILELQPRSFNYKVGDDQSRQTGLIAEEVYKIMPELVVLDQEGLPQTVKYHDLPVLLLNEIQKLRKEVDALKAKIGV